MEGQAGGVILQHEIKEAPIEVKEMLSEQERWHLEHQKLHEKHRGHEQMHFEMFLIMIITLVVAQVVLIQWKKRHFKSYQISTFIGMWAIPVVVSLQRGFYRFLTTWLIFNIVSFYIWRRASADQVRGTTPRLVYKWFLLLHRLSYILGIAGYICMMCAIMGIAAVVGISGTTALDAGVLLLFYGLYYGVLGRDLAHICTDRLACKIGYYTHEGLPKKHLAEGVCAVCDSDIYPANDSDDDAEQNYKLACGHNFHEFCIRGWVVVGKQQTCPYCKERVDLQRMFKNPWEKPHLFYGQMLDWIRYLACWQPLIIMFAQGIYHFFGLE